MVTVKVVAVKRKSSKRKTVPMEASRVLEAKKRRPDGARMVKKKVPFDPVVVPLTEKVLWVVRNPKVPWTAEKHPSMLDQLEVAPWDMVRNEIIWNLRITVCKDRTTV